MTGHVYRPLLVAVLTVLCGLACVARRKQHQPGITPNDNTTHVPIAGSSAARTKPNHTPTRHPRLACVRKAMDGWLHGVCVGAC